MKHAMMGVVLAMAVFLLWGSAVAAPMWPAQLGMWLELTRRDSAAIPITWSVRWEVDGTRLIGGRVYFHATVSNYKNLGDTREMLVRSTETAVYMWDGVADRLVFQIAPIGTKWNATYDTANHRWTVTELISIESVTVPYGTFPTTYVYRNYFDYDDPNTPDGNVTGVYWYEYVVPGVGVVKEVDYNENFSYWVKPLVQELVQRGRSSVAPPDAVGVFRPSDGTFYLDKNKSGTWEACGTDSCLSIGMNGDVPLVGDWDGSGTSKVGAFRPSDGTFYLDHNGNGAWDGCDVDRCLQIGMNSDIPLVGDWDGSGTSKVGVFRPSDGTFYLDYNGSGTWEGCGTDKCLSIGMTGDIPLVGKW